MKKVLIVVVVVFIVIQFFRPGKNVAGDETNSISKKYNVPADVGRLLKNACNDCHSNNTNYPWYAEIQPIGWWLNDHVNDGKRHLNFSEFTTRPVAVQNHKFEEIAETVEEGEMPLASYTLFGTHANAVLSDEEKEKLVRWAHEQMEVLKSQYPADSLVLKRRAPRQEDQH